MPEEVIETDPIVDPIDPSADPSPADPVDPVPADHQDPGNGDPTDPIDPGDPIDPNADPEPAPGKEDPKAKAREEYLKRQLDKSNKELAEAKKAAETSPARQQEIQRRAQEAKQAEVQEYMDTLGVSQPQAEFLLRKQEEKTRQAVASQVQPLTGTMYETQFERIKQELATDPDIVDMKSFDKEVQAIAQQYKVAGQAFYLGNKEVVKNIYLHLQGKNSKAMIKAAEERGRKLALQDKRIEGEVGMPRTAVNGGGNAGGFTQADKDFALKQSITPEAARKIRLNREKSIKESKNKT